LLASYREQSSRLANYTQVDSTLQEIEAIFGSVENDHLGDSIDRFFNAWRELAAVPADSTKKHAVLSAAQFLVTDFQSMGNALEDLGRNLGQNIASEIDQFNQLLAQAAQLNDQILGAELGGNAANDLRDQRDLVMGEISKFAKVSVLEREDGTVDLIMAGRTLVTRNLADPLAITWVDQGGWQDAQLVTQAHKRPVELAEGKLAGLIESRNGQVKGTREKLDDLAELIAAKVNEIHVQGRSEGTVGRLFFQGDSAVTLAINPVLLSNPDLIAHSRSGSAGDNDIAREIGELPNIQLEGEGGVTLLDRYRSVIVDLAAQRSHYQFLSTSQEDMVFALQARLDSARGVSLDEEGADLVRFQNSYEASARIIAAVQEMFDTLLEL
jgi:flagellar hook-associated protein 1 FlgK